MYRLLKLTIEERCILVQRESKLFEDMELIPSLYDMDGYVQWWCCSTAHASGHAAKQVRATSLIHKVSAVSLYKKKEKKKKKNQ